MTDRFGRDNDPQTRREEVAYEKNFPPETLEDDAEKPFWFSYTEEAE